MNATAERRARRARAASFSAQSAFGLLLAVIFLAFHLPYRPASLEDLDSINFALGVRQFDVAEHQPHPPGYPLFILAVKGAQALVRSEADALAAVSIVSGALGVLAIAALFHAWDGLPLSRRASAAGPRTQAWSIAATAVAITCPLYWFTAARPLSDVAGLAAAIAVQAAILAATTERALILASFFAALATGIRSQVVWLTLPLLILKTLTLHHGGHGGHGGKNTSSRDPSSASSVSSVVESLTTLVAYTVGILVWAIPLVVLSGGPAAYWRALFSQGAEDLSGIQMLWTRPNVRTLVDALYYSLVAPWAVAWLAAIVLVFALAGVFALIRRRRPALAVLAAAFGPYFVFDLLFQETFTSRYALPLVVPIAFLAVDGARLLPKPAGLVLVALLALYGAHIGGTSVAALAAQPAPAFRLLDDMRAAAAMSSTGETPVLAMDRREEFDLRRPIRWMGGAMPPVAQKLPSPPQHEWLELVKYWNGGGRAPVWFVADPLRTDIELMQHPAPIAYRWSMPYKVLLGGVRPNEMDWHRLARPEWYVAEGWSLTPEAAGVSENDHRGLTSGEIEGWISREALGGTIMIGGRNFGGGQPTIALALDGAPLAQWTVAPGFFLRVAPLPTGSGTAGEYAKLTIRASPPSRVAIEQFDASAVRPLIGFGDGWHEQEYNPQTGLRWRWLSEKGRLDVRSPVRAIRLRLEGESPRKYFSRASRLVVRAGEQVVFDQTLSADFSFDIAVPNVVDTVTLETDQIFVPADRSRPWRRSGDLRHLGLRIFKCELQ